MLSKLFTMIVLMFIVLDYWTVNSFCAESHGNQFQSLIKMRSFGMGFSSWPYDLTVDAVNWVYEHAGRYGDMIDEHLEEGVPWPESYSGQPFTKNYQDGLSFRRSKQRPGHKLLISINPLSITRTALAAYRGDEPDQKLPDPWNGYSFNDPRVKEAYLKYARRMIDFFNPDFLCIGVEVNLLKRDRPQAWNSYLELHRYVYTELKKEFPQLKIFVSLELCSLLGYNDADETGQRQALKDILPFTDILGISLHPFMSKYLAERVPDDMFTRIRALTEKPIAITETSYPAQKFSLFINGHKADFKGTQNKQREYIRRLLEAAQKDRYLFVVWFAIRDYDQLWQKLDKVDLLLIWRDTGLFDEAGRPRPGLHVWSAWEKAKNAVGP